MPCRVWCSDEVRAGNERDAGRSRTLEQHAGIGTFGQLEPDEVAALRPAPTRVRKLALQRFEHRVATGAEERPHSLEVRLEVAAPQELEHRRLSDEDRRDVCGRCQRL